MQGSEENEAEYLEDAMIRNKWAQNALMPRYKSIHHGIFNNCILHYNLLGCNKIILKKTLFKDLTFNGISKTYQGYNGNNRDSMECTKTETHHCGIPDQTTDS